MQEEEEGERERRRQSEERLKGGSWQQPTVWSAAGGGADIAACPLIRPPPVHRTAPHRTAAQRRTRRAGAGAGRLHVGRSTRPFSAVEAARRRFVHIVDSVSMSQASPIAERLSRYAYSPSQRTTRKRPRPLPVKEEASSPSDSEGSGDDYDTSDSDTDAPRVRATKKRADGTVVKYGWPKDVKVAHPSKYEDYPELDDLLRPELDCEYPGGLEA